MARKVISKKIRFEVFKRDKFTCQYCGRASPGVILHIDHIKPVSKGGDNSIVNLVTSCQECNSGKSNIELKDDIAVKKQKAQLEKIQERREQLKMMMDWRDECLNMEEEIIDKLLNEFLKYVSGQYSIAVSGHKNIKKWLKKFSYIEISEAMQISSKYLENDKDNKITKESAEKFFSYIPKIAYNRKYKTDLDYQAENKARYILGILKHKFYFKDWELINLFKDISKILKENSLNNYDEIYDKAHNCDDITDFFEYINSCLTGG